MDRIKHSHDWKYVSAIAVFGLPAVLLIRAFTSMETLPARGVIAIPLLGLSAIFTIVPLLRMASLTIDPVAGTFQCWWGFLWPLRSMHGRLNDVVGLEVRTHAWWQGRWPHRVYLVSRTTTPIVVGAANSVSEARQEAGWLARDLDTDVLET
jgi:hypothetical protein